MVSQWFSNGFSKVFQWISNGFPMVSQWFSNAFLMVFQWFCRCAFGAEHRSRLIMLIIRFVLVGSFFDLGKCPVFVPMIVHGSRHVAERGQVGMCVHGHGEG